MTKADVKMNTFGIGGGTSIPNDSAECNDPPGGCM